MRALVIALCGLPGSGKSTLARALASATGCERLDRDALRGELFRADEGYDDAGKRRLNEAMLARLGACLERRASVILDGMTFARATERARFRALAEEYDARWLLAWLDCDVALAIERVRGDVAHPAADRNAALVASVAARFEAPANALRVDAALAVDEQRDIVLRELSLMKASSSRDANERRSG